MTTRRQAYQRAYQRRSGLLDHKRKLSLAY